MTLQPSSLIICSTPLQLLIAEKIINLKQEEVFDLLLIVQADNEKYQYYYNRLKSQCHRSWYFIRQAGYKNFLFFKRDLRCKGFNKHYQNLYIASIDSRHAQYFASFNKNAKIFTFDDGTANIIPYSIYYVETKPRLAKRIIWRALGVKLGLMDIRELSNIHYTIYENITNITDRTYYINLLSNSIDDKPTTNSNCISVYLGQPLLDISNHYNKQYLKEILENMKIDLYFPHPRENISNIPTREGYMKIVSSHLVFEDFIIKLLNDHPEAKIKVYSFTSTALINVANLSRVEATYIHDSFMRNKFNNYYRLAEECFRIRSKNINER